MAMTIGEAGATGIVLRAITGDPNVDTKQLMDALEFLNERAAKSLQLSRIVMDGHELDAAARRIVQANEDAR